MHVVALLADEVEMGLEVVQGRGDVAVAIAQAGEDPVKLLDRPQQQRANARQLVHDAAVAAVDPRELVDLGNDGENLAALLAQRLDIGEFAGKGVEARRDRLGVHAFRDFLRDVAVARL